MLRIGAVAVIAWSSLAVADPVCEPAATPPSIAALIASGGCHEQRGELAQAIAAYRRAQTSAFETGDPAAEADAKQRAQTLAWQVPTVTLMIVSAPRELTIAIDGLRLAPTEYSHHELDPGSHTLVAFAPGQTPLRTTLTLRVAEHQSVPIALDPAAPVAVDPGRTRRRAGMIVGGAGLALFAGTYVWASHEAALYHELHDPPRQNAIVMRVRYLGTASTAIAAAAILTGAVLYLGAPDEKRVAVAPVAGDGSYGVTVAGGF